MNVNSQLLLFLALRVFQPVVLADLPLPCNAFVWQLCMRNVIAVCFVFGFLLVGSAPSTRSAATRTPCLFWDSMELIGTGWVVLGCSPGVSRSCPVGGYQLARVPRELLSTCDASAFGIVLFGQGTLTFFVLSFFVHALP